MALPLVPLAYIAGSSLITGLTAYGINKALSNTIEGRAIVIAKGQLGDKWPENKGVSEAQAMAILSHYKELLKTKKIGTGFQPSDLRTAAESAAKKFNILAVKALEPISALRLLKPTDGEPWDYFRANVPTKAEQIKATGKGLLDPLLPPNPFSKAGEFWAQNKTSIILLLVLIGVLKYKKEISGAIGMVAKKLPNKNPSNSAIFKKFMDRQPNLHYTESIPGDLTKLAEIGTMPEILYTSDKWDNKKEDYLHEFKNPPKLFLNDTGTAAVIYPIKVTEHGFID